MDRQQQLSRLAQRLARATADGDWRAVAALDREAAELLRAASQRPWLLQEHAALDALRRAHAAAREQCEREAARLDGLLAQMRSRRDGWMAYAMSDELDEVPT
ncbi:MAG TPA: hypothetical protein PKE27_01120 [Povalibacter sp.]|uniref:hypothetical protein n=1 Tax=Povalibacter sp. TaxID=1962978 RepID=UPI002C0487C4|nr:hypothetical protein [Povalibacter sp.]HMN43149.1 hypothetical protein [Povalibacter sp.]